MQIKAIKLEIRKGFLCCCASFSVLLSYSWSSWLEMRVTCFAQLASGYTPCLTHGINGGKHNLKSESKLRIGTIYLDGENWIHTNLGGWRETFHDLPHICIFNGSVGWPLTQGPSKLVLDPTKLNNSNLLPWSPIAFLLGTEMWSVTRQVFKMPLSWHENQLVGSEEKDVHPVGQKVKDIRFNLWV